MNQTGVELELYGGCLLFLMDGLNAENQFYYVVLSITVGDQKNKKNLLFSSHSKYMQLGYLETISLRYKYVCLCNGRWCSFALFLSRMHGETLVKESEEG